LKRSVVLAELLLRRGLKLRLLGIDLRLLLLLEVRGVNGSLTPCRGAGEQPDGSTDRGTLAGIASNRAADSPHRGASYSATRRGVSRSVRMLLRCLLHLLGLLLGLRLLRMPVRKGLGRIKARVLRGPPVASGLILCLLLGALPLARVDNRP
jgi:hypothetical protein